MRGKDFLFPVGEVTPIGKGGEQTLAISKERKNDLVSQYKEWAENSRAMIVTEYTGLTMKQIDELRAKAREVGGEFHIVKNTLGKVAFTEAGLPLTKDMLQGSTAIGFAFKDAPAMAKTLSEFARTSDFLKIKGGYLGQRSITAADVKSLAELPPLEVLRAQILGTLLAPAGKLVRTLAEPGRSLAAVIKAIADKDNAAAAGAAEAAPA
jgi:large subunit ribosomal protein L10